MITNKPSSKLESIKGDLQIVLQIDNQSEMKLSLNEKLQIHEFKRYLLTLTDNKPFYLKVNICNDLTLKDLVTLVSNDFHLIEVSTQREIFDLEIHRNDDSEAGNLVLFDLNDKTTFGDLHQMILE